MDEDVLESVLESVETGDRSRGMNWEAIGLCLIGWVLASWLVLVWVVAHRPARRASARSMDQTNSGAAAGVSG